MNSKRPVSLEEACLVGKQIGIDWTDIDREEFRCGLEFELEHRVPVPEPGISGEDLILAGKITRAHLKAIQDYYTLLNGLEFGEKVKPWTTDWLMGRVRHRSSPTS